MRSGVIGKSGRVRGRRGRDEGRWGERGSRAE